MLDHTLVLRIQQAAIGAQLDRGALLTGIHPHFVASLPQRSAPAAQLLSDLSTMNDTGALADGSVPLLIWLKTAVQLAAIRREVAVFREALTELTSILQTGDNDAAIEHAGQGRGSLLTILFLAANPSQTSRLALDEEVREIGERLRSAKLRDLFRLESEWAVRPGDLSERLLRHRPTIVHFSGHGSAAGQLLLQGEGDEAVPVDLETLATLFRLVRRHVRVVVLNACFSQPQAAAIAEHIDVVIGMNVAIGDAAARAFSGGFYQALAYGQDVEAAFAFGQVQMGLLGSRQTAVPVLLTRAGVKASEIILAGRRPAM